MLKIRLGLAASNLPQTLGPKAWFPAKLTETQTRKKTDRRAAKLLQRNEKVKWRESFIYIAW
jgi:hypothetical protein